jgi:DNA invertase Pin-like site-specific DNA recombinase
VTHGQKTGSQKRELLAHFCQRGWKNVVVCEDKLSDVETSRPALGRLVQDMRAGQMSLLICFKLSGWARA